MSSTAKPPKRTVSGLLDAGVWLQVAGDAKGAREIFRQALELEPTNARAKLLYGADDVSKPDNATIQVRPSQAVADQRPDQSTKQKLDALLRQVRKLRAQGEVDKASGVVLRALLLDDTSLDAHEAAYELLCEQERNDVAAVELVHFVKLCIDHGQMLRARRYLPDLIRLRSSDPKMKGLTAALTGDPEETLP